MGYGALPVYALPLSKLEPHSIPMTAGHPQGVPLQTTLQIVRSQRTCRGRSCADPGSIESVPRNRHANSFSLAKVNELAVYSV